MVPSDKWDRSENVDYTVNRTSPLLPGLTHSSLLKKTAPLALLSWRGRHKSCEWQRVGWASTGPQHFSEHKPRHVHTRGPEAQAAVSQRGLHPH